MKYRGHEFEGEQEGVYGSFGLKDGREKYCHYNLKKFKSLLWKGGKKTTFISKNSKVDISFNKMSA